ncbi:uncharacterized protein LOC115364876 [Myripristis murdjan]|uniref:Uncharacterized LOC115364876 n=1 Tax=Myripristis murdjan TaxID=586833 RepID=A0A667X8I2_9TELE|nr:uncharacterized protein LOC115364876 [Myripristis murdjan]XP_029915398.1 uncharacterized protein LOC115364876 [Myripristis murdjan]
MNPYSNPTLNSCLSPHEGATPSFISSPPLFTAPNSNLDTHSPSLSAALPSHPIIQTGHSSHTLRNGDLPPFQAPSAQDLNPNVIPCPFTSLPPASDPGFSLSPPSEPYPHQTPVSSLPLGPTLEPILGGNSTPNPYADPSTHLSQVSVVVPSPGLCPSSEEMSCPDLECAICFSQFNNVFRCPKMLQCKHTFCLECLARINVKSTQPNVIQCPLCRGLTPLPTLGLPKLATDSDVLSYLPAAMQRVYSIRFVRNKGKLQVKRSSEGRQCGQRSLTSFGRSLDVGLPSPPAGGLRGGGAEAGAVGGALFRLTGQPACRAFLLTSVVMMMLLLTGIIIFLLFVRNSQP